MSSSAPTFVHLNVHTEYSLVDSIARVKPLVKAAVAAQMPALAVTERDNVFSLVKFYRAAVSAGLKPILGADLSIKSDEVGRPTRLIALCRHIEGYRCLSRLLTRAYREGQQHGMPELSPEWIEADNEGLLFLSGGPQGDIGTALLASKVDDARRRTEYWASRFPDRFYLELQRLGRPGDDADGAARPPLPGPRNPWSNAVNEIALPQAASSLEQVIPE